MSKELIGYIFFITSLMFLGISLIAKEILI